MNKNFAFVQFAEESEAQNAIKDLHRAQHFGRRLGMHSVSIIIVILSIILNFQIYSSEILAQRWFATVLSNNISLSFEIFNRISVVTKFG